VSGFINTPRMADIDNLKARVESLEEEVETLSTALSRTVKLLETLSLRVEKVDRTRWGGW
jgi:hypothetical protein